MTETLEHQIGLCTQEQISMEELTIINLILDAQEAGNVALLGQYLMLPESIRGDLRTHLVSLQNRGFILKEYKIPNKGEVFDIYDVKLNKNFTKRFHKENYDLGSELYDHYPQFGSINGALVQINTVSKKFDSLELAFIAYAKAINNNPTKHKEVIELVDWAKDTNVLNCSLASFIVDRRWEALSALKNGGSGINFNAVKLI